MALNSSPLITSTRAAAQNSAAVLRTAGLSRSIDGKPIVHDVNISVNQGEVVAIVGSSGAGKSSLLRLLNRLDEPTAGTVYLDGQDYHQIAPCELRHRVGMVMQAPNLFPGTVAENIRFGPRVHGQELPDSTLEQLLARVDLPGYAERTVDKLSGGEAQRVSLARTLANSPQILLLDEPTAALDDATKHEVESLIDDIIHEQHITCLLVTHDMDQAKRFARRILVMRAGQIEKDGSLEEELDAKPNHS